MKLSVIIPHYAVGKMTSYTIAKLLQYKGKHELDIIVVDNKPLDGSYIYLEPFMDKIAYWQYPEGVLQSHGIAISWAIQNRVKTKYVLCLENDAYPTMEFVDYYADLAEKGYDAAGSIMTLSGGTYLHPCAALYKTSTIFEAESDCSNMPFDYFPNMAMRNNFPCHLMVNKHTRMSDGLLSDLFLSNPEDFIELADAYKPHRRVDAVVRRNKYLPVVCAFHNGMGGNQESIHTYGQRTYLTEAETILADEPPNKIIYRMGYEPGQWLYYYLIKKGYEVFDIPTTTHWMPGRENQQQEYSINEAGIKHIWGVSSYTERPADGVEDIYATKRGIPDMLYNTLPKHQRID